LKVFVISDPHYGRDMSVYDPVWKSHESEIHKRWSARVVTGDLVLIPGDVSWAVTTKTVRKHLEEINSLPGRVVISPGNHDRWWKKTERLQYDRMRFLNDAFMPLGEEWTIAASMGSDTPESPWWKPEMQADMAAAIARLDGTLALAARSRPDTKILLMIHYPPRWAESRTPTEIERVIARYPVELVVYGHIHGQDLCFAHNRVLDVLGRRVRYENASCDRIRFDPLLVLDLPGAQLTF
jgi:uncharacterized protein